MSSSDSDSDNYPSVSSTMGAYFLGVIFSMTMWGGACVQTHHYFNRFPRDDWRIKSLVVAVLSLLTVHQALAAYTVYTSLVIHYNDQDFLQLVIKTNFVGLIFCALVCFLVQSFLLYRIWNLSHRNMYMVSFLLFLMLGQFASMITYFVETMFCNNYGELAKFAWISRSINIFAAAADISLALVLIYLLQRSRTGYKQTDTIIMRLTIFTFTTGFSVSFCALLTLITNLVFPNTLVYLIFFLCDSPLYTNTLLATLNTRRSSKDGFAEELDNNDSSDSSRRFRFRSGLSSQAARKSMLQIKVETETCVDISSAMSGNKSATESVSDAGSNFLYEGKGDVFRA